MRKVSSAIAALAALTFAGSAAAQSPLPLSVEVRGGLPFPTGEFKDVGSDIGDGLTAGYNLSASVTVDVTPRVGVYAGYSFNHFQVEERDDIGVNSDGFEFGVRGSFPTTTGVGPFVKVGGVYHDAEVVFDDDAQQGPDDVDVSKNHLGFEVGGGVEVALGRYLSLTPGVSYVRVPTDEAFDPDVSYVKADVGLRLRL